MSTESKKLGRFDFLEAVRMRIQKYQDVTSAILEDYEALAMPVDSGMITELGAADANLLNAIEELDVEPEKEMLLDSLKDAVYDNTVEADDVLNLLDIDDVKTFALNDFDICVNCTDNNIRTKLEEFIKTEIYPYVLDQNKYTNL